MGRITGKKGLTMIELLVGMMVFSIIALSVSAIVVPFMRISSSANDFSENNILLTRISGEIISDMNRAISLTLTTDNVLIIGLGARGTIVYSVCPDEGLLQNGDSKDRLFNVYDEMFYKGRTVGLQFMDINEYPFLPSADNVDITQPVKLKITLFSGGEPSLSRIYAVNPLGLS
jgi:prepilin-type N-terminal cleavage/methylation domain-containing protein